MMMMIKQKRPQVYYKSCRMEEPTLHSPQLLGCESISRWVGFMLSQLYSGNSCKQCTSRVCEQRMLLYYMVFNQVCIYVFLVHIVTHQIDHDSIIIPWTTTSTLSPILTGDAGWSSGAAYRSISPIWRGDLSKCVVVFYMDRDLSKCVVMKYAISSSRKLRSFFGRMVCCCKSHCNGLVVRISRSDEENGR